MALRFGTAGVRGVYGRELGVANIASFCAAVSRVMGEGRYGVGYDTRRGSFVLAEVACAALMWGGRRALQMGLVPTPVVAFAAHHFRLTAALALTASHNPPDYVGVKVFDGEGLEVGRGIEARIEAAAKSPPSSDGFGNPLEKRGVIEEYLGRAVRSVPAVEKGMRILVDGNNGVGSLVTPRLLRTLGHQVVTVNCHLSWRFPGRSPEPRAENLMETADLVRRIGVSIGFVHDADADRLVVIDEHGRILPDSLLSALMLRIVAQGKSGDVVVSSNSSLAVERVAEEMGCRVVRAPLGRTSHELYGRRGIYATEPSKIVIPAWGPWEDGIFAAALLVQHVCSSGGLGPLLTSIPRYSYVQKDLPQTRLSDEALKELVRRRYRGKDVNRMEEVDGIRIELKDGWVMFRRSGTEPKVRIYAEARTESEATRLLNEAEELIRTNSNA